MKILIISMSYPYPPKSGGKSRLYNLIKELSKHNNISLVSLIYEDEMEYIPELLKFCERVEVVPFEHNIYSKITRWLNIISSLFTDKPIEVAAKESKLLQRKINEIIGDKFDIIQVEWLQMAKYLPFHRLKNVPLILVEHDIAYVPYQRRSDVKKGILKYIFQRECNKLKEFERAMCLKFDNVFVMSEIDETKLLNLTHVNLNTTVIPNGVDPNYIQPKIPRHNSNSLLFIGWMKHYPNRDAVNFFLNQIFPFISKSIPDIKFYIIGQHLPKDLLTLVESNPNIIYLGYVEDVRKYLHCCTVFVCPLRIGGGTRLKILEAMAAGIPVISTSIGAEGLNITSNRDIIIEDKPEAFAERTIELLYDAELREKIAINARRLIEENYSWESIAIEIEKSYDELKTSYK